MQRNVRAIIFDLDGVIVNSNPDIVKFWKEWSNKEGFDLTDAQIGQWIYGRKVGDTLAGLFNHLSKERKQEIEESAIIFDSTTNPGSISGVVTFIESLQKFQIPVGVVTSSHYSRMLNMLQKFGIEKLFTHFITANDVNKGKPHPEPYLKMSEKMNIANESCLVFEDAISGIQSAVAAGMLAIGIGHDINKQDLLLHGAIDVVKDFNEIECDLKRILVKNGNKFRVD
jgi:sugar-phosphatase